MNDEEDIVSLVDTERYERPSRNILVPRQACVHKEGLLVQQETNAEVNPFEPFPTHLAGSMAG